jgi:hypothetical protein
MSKLALGLVLAVAAISAHAQGKAGEVLFAAGHASRVSADGAARPLQRGDAVYESDTLRTGSEAHLQVRMSDGALIALRPASELRLKSYGERASLELVEGALRSITGAIGRRDKTLYNMQLPYAILGIRGTDHEARVVKGAPGAGTYDRVTLGGTYLQTRAGRVDLDPGQTGFVPLKPDAVPVRLEETPDFMLAFLPPPAPDTAPGTRGLLRAPGLERAPGLDRAPGLPGSQAPALLLERGGVIPGDRRPGLPNGKAKH